VVCVLAGKFHWPDRYIRRELPLSRVNSLLHAVAATNPYLWTVDDSVPVVEESRQAELDAMAMEDDEIDIEG